ncbi:MAG: hypothetical protein HZA63_02025 [Rhodocyclales bacterium]|nr:hypothetical protein [Rhodocyclales bacterium]
MAIFGGKSTCKHCGATFSATPTAKKINIALGLAGLAATRFIEKLLKSFVRPETAFLIILVGLVFLGLALTKLSKVDARGSDAANK